MMSWVSLSFGVVDFGMMPSVGDGSYALHHHDPAIRLSAAGSGGLFALRLWPGLDPPGSDSNAPFASERQSFLRRRQRFDGAAHEPTVAQAPRAPPSEADCQPRVLLAALSGPKLNVHFVAMHDVRPSKGRHGRLIL
jgi:hypothetical protein